MLNPSGGAWMLAMGGETSASGMVFAEAMQFVTEGVKLSDRRPIYNKNEISS